MIRLKGITMIIIGSVLWGLTGPMMEWILGVTDISVPFLLAVRLTLCGLLILMFLLLSKTDIFSVWKSATSRIQLIIFSILGVLGLQYTFLATIEQSDAVIGTLFQFSAPILIVIYVSLTHKELPPKNQVIGIAGTLIGLFLLLTNGSLDSLSVSVLAVIFGLGVGLTFAFYTLYPAFLMKEWGILIILGWGMLIAGVFVGVASRIWNSDEWHYLGQTNVALMMIILIIFTIIAYTLFLSSLKYITAVETSILSSVEPLTVMIVSVLWFGAILESVQLIGVLLMLIFVTWLSLGSGRGKVKKERKIKKQVS